MDGKHDEGFAQGDSFRADLLALVDRDGRPLRDGQGSLPPFIRETRPDIDPADAALAEMTVVSIAAYRGRSSATIAATERQISPS